MGRVAVPFGTGKLRFPGIVVDVLRTGSRIGMLALDEAVVREPVQMTRSPRRTGRDSNPQDQSVVYHVLHTGSRACFESDEVVNQRRYGALPLQLRALPFGKSRRWDSNPQPPGSEAMYSNRQSVMYLVATKCWSEALPATGIEPADRLERSPDAGGRNRTDVLQAGSRRVSKCPTKGSQEVLSLRPSVPATKSPIVDWPLHLR